MIISAALTSMFPRATHADITLDATAVNPALTAPLNYMEFMTSVLLPYTAILLIKADMSSSFLEAWNTWQQSSTWGSVHFPCPHDSEDPLSPIIGPSCGPYSRPTARSTDFVPVKPEPTDDDVVVLSLETRVPQWRSETHVNSIGNSVPIFVLDD